MITDDFLEGLPEETLEAGKLICESFLSFHVDEGKGHVPQYENYMEWYALLSVFLEEHKLPYELPDLSTNQRENLDHFISAVIWIKDEIVQSLTSHSVNNLKARFQARIHHAFAYEFSEGDLTRIQNLINELRTLITESEKFEENHRRRLLKRLERLQAELHKRVSDLDRFWGLVGDAGVAIGKFGKDAKPLVDRIKEIADIVWRTQARAEELPSGTPTPLLKSPDSEDT